MRNGPCHLLIFLSYPVGRPWLWLMVTIVDGAASHPLFFSRSRRQTE
jgi:hypothetical protein